MQTASSPCPWCGGENGKKFHMMSLCYGTATPAFLPSVRNCRTVAFPVRAICRTLQTGSSFATWPTIAAATTKPQPRKRVEDVRFLGAEIMATNAGHRTALVSFVVIGIVVAIGVVGYYLSTNGEPENEKPVKTTQEQTLARR